MSTSAPGGPIPEHSDAAYAAALSRVARELGLDADELDRKMVETAGSLAVSRDCLSLGEIERFPTFASLPKDRRKHVQTCQVCTAFLNAIAAPPAEVSTFAVKAASSVGSRKWLAPFQWRWRPALVGAVVAWLLVLPLAWGHLKSTQRQQESLVRVLGTIVEDEASIAANTESQLQEVLAKHQSEQAAFRSIATASLVASQRALEERRDALSAVPALRSVAWSDVVAASEASQKAGEHNLTEQLYLDFARSSCEAASSELGEDAQAIREGFARLQEAVRITGGSGLTWAGPYVTVHRQVESLMTHLEQKSKDAGATPSSGAAARLRACDTFLEQFASIRVARWKPTSANSQAAELLRSVVTFKPTSTK